MRKPPFSAALTVFGNAITATFMVVLLAGCQTANKTVTGEPLKLVVPEVKVIDYQAVDCDRLWDLDDQKTVTNALYWLRATDCAARLAPAQARAEARRWSDDNWQSAFRQGVLMANGNVTPVERRQYMLRLDTFSLAYPDSVRALIQLWRDNQAAQLQLSEERTRYHHLQQNSDAQLDALRQQQVALTNELKLTRRKLETLTDIERQLSTRRSADNADNNHSDKSAAGSGAQTSSEETTQP
ncbi:two-component system QseEF-associated lipoprotein QseG [Pantoea sp. CCBC3-3-1]|uniref:two-component system QseEF-associated lipoprotein QseG n=1 Tax=Pantoea sp. CCBC3-3-1 TaxID=2490851 RepID=UPI0011BF6C7E|nr:two-component system QseEF-associated lipoprotein QseG [Pantoea sp. CCBC3-3-1]